MIHPTNLIEDIYAAAENPALWRSVVESLTQAVGGTVGALVFEDLERHTAGFAEIVGEFDPALIPSYQSYYAARNPWMERAISSQSFLEGQVIIGQQVLPDEELVKSEYYNDLLARSDLHHLTGMMLVREPRALSQLSVLKPRRRRAFGEREAAYLEEAAVHLRRAFRIHRKIARMTAERDALGEGLEHVPYGVVILGRGLRVLHMNRPAATMLASRDGLLLVARGVTASSSADAEALRAALEAASGHAGTPRSGGALVIRRPSGRAPLSVLVSPFQLAGRPEGGTVGLFITDPERVCGAVDVWRRLYGLTMAEAALAARLVEGESPARAAEALGITTGTARTQLKRLFAKTETNRQAELVRTLLMSGSNLDASGH